MNPFRVAALFCTLALTACASPPPEDQPPPASQPAESTAPADEAAAPPPAEEPARPPSLSPEAVAELLEHSRRHDEIRLFVDGRSQGIDGRIKSLEADHLVVQPRVPETSPPEFRGAVRVLHEEIVRLESSTAKERLRRHEAGERQEDDLPDGP